MKPIRLSRPVLAVLAFAALVLSGLPATGAGCAFGVRSDASSYRPRTDAIIVVECLHDAAGNMLAGKSVVVKVTRPNAGMSSHVVTTNESGGATFAYTNTHGIGSYALEATSGDAVASGGFVVATEPASGAFRLLPSDTCVLAGSPMVTLNAFGIRDPSGDPAAPSDVTFTIRAPAGATAIHDAVTPPVTFVRTATSTRPVPASDTDFTTASVVFDFLLPDNMTVHAPAGNWSVTAATLSASATTGFRVVDAIPAGTPAAVTLTGPTARVVPGGVATLTANVKNAAGANLVCSPVTFTVTPPSGPAVVATVQTNSSGNAVLPYVHTDAYGTYKAVATAGAATSNNAVFRAYSASIGFSSANPSYSLRAVPGRQLLGNAVTLLAANVVDTARRPIGGGNAPEEIELWTTPPGGQQRFQYRPAVTPATKRTGRADASAVLAGHRVTKTGDWLFQAFTGSRLTGDPALDWNIDALGLFLTTFQSTTFQVVSSLPAESPGSPVRDLGVSATDTDTLGGAVTVSISNIPAAATEVTIEVTKPDATTYTKSTTTILAGEATIMLGGASETDLEGIYSVAATSLNGTTPNGVGSATFVVAVPRSLSVAADPNMLALPGDSTTVTATFVETLTSNPIANAPVQITVANALGLTVATRSGMTGVDGTYSETVDAEETLLPGTYRVTATSGDHSATTTFVVLVPVP